MTSKSRIKGKSWERDVVKFLSEAYQKPFLRVVNSGAFIGGKNFHRKATLDTAQAKSHRGDINPPDTWLRFNAEAKNYDDLALHQLFTGECTKLDDWLAQLLAVSQSDDLNILFIKLSRKGRLVCVQDHDWILESYMVYNSSVHGTWIITDLDRFFANNKSKIENICTETISNP